MRRRPALLAALGAGGVVALCLGVIGAAAAASSRETTVAVVDADTVVPSDLTWAWVRHCEYASGVDLGNQAGWFSTDEDGELVVEYGMLDQEGHLAVDDELTAIVGACVDAQLADLDFDVLLEARLACPPMPSFLAAQGVGW